jgi:hypothetical protein
MFENDYITGMGISQDDQKAVKYIGEHKNGDRDGKGILMMPDGKEYEGAWRKNRIRGESSVNTKLIFDSLIGLIRIYLKKLVGPKNN